MDTVVQFIRNALCCAKDLNWFESTFLHDAAYTERIFGYLIYPLNKTTPLEVIISVTQFYACVSNTRSGISLIHSSVGKLRRIVWLVEKRMNAPPKTITAADRIVNDSLLKEGRMALRSTFIGVLVAPVGICFWWLTVNSWHVTETDWFGGLPGLIHALEVMEVCLVPLLYFMIVDGLETLKKSEKAKTLVEVIQTEKLAPSAVSVQTFEVMTTWVPFWDAGVSMFSSFDETELEKKLNMEVESVKNQLATWFPSEGDKTKGEKEAKQSKEAFAETKAKLEGSVHKLRMEGYREFLYFVLNFAAFYGYLMAPLTFYYDIEESQPYHIQSMKLFYGNEDADWTGNFAGDFCWTIEPL
eukprot:scaffold24612_cov132-Cylindrotheca_fusiformis.AAC.5